MNGIAFSRWLAALICLAGTGCAAEVPTAAQAPTAQLDGVQTLNQPVPTAMTCGAIKALLVAGDKRTGGLAILWLEGTTLAASGSPNCPPAGRGRLLKGLGELARSP